MPSCYGNRYVISDIHGCLKTLVKLVERIDLKQEDQLFFLGDYIDRGADSKGVLDYIIDLSKKHQIYPLKGNHEYDLELLVALNNKNLFQRFSNKGNNILNDDFSIDSKYLNFIKNLPYFYEIENHFLVHAGFDFNNNYHFENTVEMLWIRNWNYDEKKANGKTIIHGHDMTPLDKIKLNILNNEKIIPLDNGCFYTEESDFGNLLCLNINKNELIVQKNIEPR